MESAFQHDTSMGSQESAGNTRISGVVQVQVRITQKHRSFGSNSFKQTETKCSLGNTYQLQLLLAVACCDGVREKPVSGTWAGI